MVGVWYVLGLYHMHFMSHRAFLEWPVRIVSYFKDFLYSRKKGMPELSMSIMKSRKAGALGGVSVKPMCFMSRIPPGVKLCAMIR